MKTLAIEAACPPGSIAVAEAGRTVCFRQLEDVRRTTQTFALVISDVLAEANWQPHDIELVATTEGPGSFTGLRIGVTAAKVFAYAVQAKAIGISTLAVIARQATTDGELEVVLDAQRGEWFGARFRKQGNVVEQLGPTQIIQIDTWLGTGLGTGFSPADVIGPGLNKIDAKLREKLSGQKVVIQPEDLWCPRADTLARIAFELTSSGVETSPWKLKPRYLRRSAAEEKADGALADS